MSFDTPKKSQRAAAVPFSPLDTMEKMVNHDEDVAQYDSKPIIDAMKEGTFFNIYKKHNNRIIKERIFMYYRQDSQLGSLYYTAATSDICAPKREQPVPAGHTQLSFKRVTDIWLGKQTDVLLHPDAECAAHTQCWTIFADDTNRKSISMDLEADTEEVLSEWLFGINVIMSSGGRLLTKKEEEEEAAALAAAATAASAAATAAPAAPAPVLSARAQELLTPAKPKKNQRRYSIQVLSSSSKTRHADILGSVTHAHGSLMQAAPSNTAVAAQAQLAQLKKKLRANFDTQVAQLKSDIARNRTLIAQDLSRMQDAMEFAAEAIRSRIAEEQVAVKAEKMSILRSLKRERELRVRLMNQLIEEHGNIRVFARVRPLNAREQSMGSCVVVGDKSNENKVYASEEEELMDAIVAEEDAIEVLNVDGNGAVIEGDGAMGARGGSTTFHFDKVFGPGASQATVGREVVPFVRSCLDGYNVCIFAYGQTGSGKTYTMEGNDANLGVNYTALRELFKQIQLAQDTARKAGHQIDYNVEVAVVEIYNEIPRDLLRAASDDTKIDIRYADGVVSVPGLTRVAVSSSEQVKTLLDTRAKPNRSVAKTNMNAESSRSHCSLFVYVDALNHHTRESTAGKLVLVDLAGSERVLKSGVQGQGLKEAQNINKSLSALGDVIQALQNKDKHVPYRNSKLTFLLQDCLGGNAKCLMFCNISPAAINQNETLCSLRFAARARNTQLGKAKKNTSAGSAAPAGPAVRVVEDTGALKAKERELATLRAENEALTAENAQTYKTLLNECKSKDAQIKELMARLDAQQREVNTLKRQSVAMVKPRMSTARRRASILDSDVYQAMATPRRMSGQKRKSLEHCDGDMDGENNEDDFVRPAARPRTAPAGVKRSSSVGFGKTVSKPSAAASSAMSNAVKKAKPSTTTARPGTAALGTPRKPLSTRF